MGRTTGWHWFLSRSTECQERGGCSRSISRVFPAIFGSFLRIEGQEILSYWRKRKPFKYFFREKSQNDVE